MNKYKKALSLFLVMMTIFSVPVLAEKESTMEVLPVDQPSEEIQEVELEEKPVEPAKPDQPAEVENTSSPEVEEQVEVAQVEKFESKEILILGNDLTPQMIQELKQVYGITGPIEELIITNKEEHEALGEYISAEVITNKSMSSAYVKLLEPGSGIKVKTHNINWVSEDMYRNALSTAGIKDAEVMVAGPFPVSGTAALTGSMKAYEKLTGIKISEASKDAANDEMITTVELGDEIGKDEAEKIITEVKIFIAENDIKDPKVIKEAIEDAANNINITLTDEQIQQITSLMEKISKIEIDVDQMKSQLGDMIDKIDQIDINTEEVKGILFKMIDAIKGFFDRVFG